MDSEKFSDENIDAWIEDQLRFEGQIRTRRASLDLLLSNLEDDLHRGRYTREASYPDLFLQEQVEKVISRVVYYRAGLRKIVEGT